MKLLELLREISRAQNLPFLLIGGHAVNLWGYSRNTHDLDLLVRKTQLDQWQSVVACFGYSVFQEGPTFIQFNADGKNSVWPLDLMLVNDETFAKMFAASKAMRFADAQVSVPSIPHLIALKLHVLKQDLPHRT